MWARRGQAGIQFEATSHKIAVELRIFSVEPRGIEPLTPALQRRILPNLYLRCWRDRPVELQNDIKCNFLKLPLFVPKCAQNVPSADSSRTTLLPLEGSQAPHIRHPAQVGVVELN
jgi:hypothetical protein